VSRIIFSHANGFPASTYRLIIQALREAGHHVDAIECIGHDPHFPVSSNWPKLVEQLATSIPALNNDRGEATWLLGHSLGGYLSMMCAAHLRESQSQAIAGVIVLDAPIIGGWKARGLRLVKRSSLVGALLPGRPSRKRRRQWPDQAAVRLHFEHKRAFKHWDPRVLDDYVNFGTKESKDQHGLPCRSLVFDRDIETLIYNTVPDHLEHYFKSHPMRCPLIYIGGRQSFEAMQVGLASTLKLLARLSQSEFIETEGSHLFPMEYPDKTVELLLRLLPS
jgi:pimeloyl-ACP methyl ester carboxylesterase